MELYCTSGAETLSYMEKFDQKKKKMPLHEGLKVTIVTAFAQTHGIIPMDMADLMD